jgi:hypothetical protein
MPNQDILPHSKWDLPNSCYAGERIPHAVTALRKLVSDNARYDLIEIQLEFGRSPRRTVIHPISLDCRQQFSFWR